MSFLNHVLVVRLRGPEEKLRIRCLCESRVVNTLSGIISKNNYGNLLLGPILEQLCLGSLHVCKGKVPISSPLNLILLVGFLYTRALPEDRKKTLAASEAAPQESYESLARSP